MFDGMKKSFDHFMWLKVTGKIDGMRTSRNGCSSVPSTSIQNYHRKMKILEGHGVLYPDWKEARKVLDEHSRSS